MAVPDARGVAELVDVDDARPGGDRFDRPDVQQDWVTDGPGEFGQIPPGGQHPGGRAHDVSAVERGAAAVGPHPDVLSTAPRLMYGLMTKAGDRCASTWSGPFCASSSSTKIADSFQYLLWEITSTRRPSA